MKKEGNYGTGILGAVVGGLIATLPWILLYVFGNMMLSILAIIIAFGAKKGYEICRGKKTKYLPIIVTVVSVISVSIATLVIIPLVILHNEGYYASFNNLTILYHTSEFVGAILKDFAIAVVFTFLGISGVVSNIKKEIKTEEKSELN